LAAVQLKFQSRIRFQCITQCKYTKFKATNCRELHLQSGITETPERMQMTQPKIQEN